MFEKLSSHQFEYVLFHLFETVAITDEVRNKIVYPAIKQKDNHPVQDLIRFNSSASKFQLTDVTYINGLPVLFPVEKKAKTWYSLMDDSLIFHHDILKSAFYLLSGAYEYEQNREDALGRFPYKESLCYKLGIVEKPVVNYYFEIIFQGIDEFCIYHELERPKKRQFFNDFAFFLSHDVDRIQQFTVSETSYALMQCVGLKTSHTSTKNSLKRFARQMTGMLPHSKKEDPFSNFDWLLSLEKDLGINAAYYFIEHAGSNQNSRYNFNQKHIKQLFQNITSHQQEVGIHGTIQSAFDEDAFIQTCNNLREALNHEVSGGRQHILRYKIPKTARIHEKAGLTYDNTLGFAEHEGFRNGYCLPFRLYDFENDRMINVWQIPLNIMESTLFYYRKLNFVQAKKQFDKILTETKRFHGIISLLWHNSFFDEDEFPGIKKFYEELLWEVSSKHEIELLNGEIIVQRLKNKGF